MTGALCYLDLDQFKVINDSLGHIAGDRLLRELGVVLQSLTETKQTLARLGGDEFGLIVEDCDIREAEAVAQKFRAEIEKFRFEWAGQRHCMGLSIGLA